MTPAGMKETVRKVWAALRDDQVDIAFSYMADDVRWDSQGRMQGEMSGRRKGKAAIRIFREAVPKAFAGPRETECRRLFCEGNTVACELWARGPLRNGNTYENVYLYIFDFRNDLIQEIREYADTQNAEFLMHGLFG
jgi:ketosteroid isomerase-like protein